MDVCNLSKERLAQVEPLMAATYVFFTGIAVVAAVVAIVTAWRAYKGLQDYSIAKWAGVTTAAAVGGMGLMVPIAYMLKQASDRIREQEYRTREQESRQASSDAPPPPPTWRRPTQRPPTWAAAAPSTPSLDAFLNTQD